MTKKNLIILLVMFTAIFFNGMVHADPGSITNDVGVFINIEYTINPAIDAALNADLVVVSNVAAQNVEMNADALLFNKNSCLGSMVLPGCKVNWLEIADANYRDEYLKKIVMIKPEIIRKHYNKLE